jgi:lysylphosphatidylglycerol synthetase-like protein (DUF2156 family)
MSQTFREKYLRGASYKLIFSIVGGLIALFLVIGLVVGFVALFRESEGSSPLIAALKAFLNAIYLPSILILILIIIGTLLYATITMIKETSGGSAKITILLIAVFIFGVSGTVKPLMNYRPEPTTGYLVTFFIVFLLQLVFNTWAMYTVKVISQQEKQIRLLIVLPFVVLTSFFIVSLIFAMIQHIKYGVVEVGFEKICTGIIMPIFAIACLLIPIGVQVMLSDGDPENKKPEAASEPAKQDEGTGQGAPPAG